jgi:hypothetical protein
MGAEEGGIGDVGFEGLFCADVDAVAFDIDAEEVAGGVHSGEADGVFAFSAGEFEGEGVVVLKEVLPIPRHAFGVLEDVGEGFYGFEADEFFLAHGMCGSSGRRPGLWGKINQFSRGFCGTTAQIAGVQRGLTAEKLRPVAWSEPRRGVAMSEPRYGCRAYIYFYAHFLKSCASIAMGVVSRVEIIKLLIGG